MSESKTAKFPITLGELKAEIRLTFHKVNGVWTCKLTDEFMSDLETCLNGEYPKERVKWVDVPNFGADNEP